MSPCQRDGSREERVSSISLHSTEQGLWAASMAETHPGATLNTALTLEIENKYKIRNTQDKSRVECLFMCTHFFFSRTNQPHQTASQEVLAAASQENTDLIQHILHAFKSYMDI